MKKNLLFSMLVVLLMMITVNVKASATCSDTREAELSSLANNVNVDYDIYEKDQDDNADPPDADFQVDTKNVFYAAKIRIFNLTSDLKVKIEKENSKQVYYANYSDVDSDGILYLDASFIYEIRTYNITIMSNDSNCPNEQLRTLTITLPMWNLFSNYSACTGNEEFYLCNQFTTTDYSGFTGTQFYNELETYKADKTAKENSIQTKAYNFFQTNKWLIIVIVLIVAAIIVYIIIKKIKKNKMRRL